MEPKTIKLLEQSQKWEDEFIMNYNSETVWELLKTLPKGKFKKIEPLLKENINESHMHYKMITSLIEGVKSGKYD